MKNIKMPDITLLLPHAEPMLLLDRVISVGEDNSLTTEVVIRHDSLFCEELGVGSWVGIEYMAQTMGAYAGFQALKQGEPVKIGFLVGTRRYECSKPYFAIGTTLQITARCILESPNGLSAFECAISDSNEKNEIIATATINAFLPENVNKFLEEV